MAMMSRRIPPTPVAAPWNGSTAEGWLWLSTLKATASPPPSSTTPAFSPGPWRTRGESVGNRFKSSAECLYAQCSDQRSEKTASSKWFGSRARSSWIRSYSRSVRPRARWSGCSATCVRASSLAPALDGEPRDGGPSRSHGSRDALREDRRPAHRLPGGRRRARRHRARRGVLAHDRGSVGPAGSRGLPRTDLLVREADLVRPAWQWSLRSGFDRRAALGRPVDGRRPGRDGRRWLDERRAAGHRGWRDDEHALRCDTSRAHGGPRAREHVRSALARARLPVGPGDRDRGRGARRD